MEKREWTMAKIGHHVRIGEVRIEPGNLVGHDQPLEHDAVGEQTGDVESGDVLDSRGGNGFLSHPANDVELPAKMGLALDVGAFAYEQLPNHGHNVPGVVADGVGVYGHVPPPEDLLSLVSYCPLKDVFTYPPLGGVLGQEHHANTVFTLRGKGDAEFGALLLEEQIGHLDENSGAVSGVGVAAAGPPVPEIHQCLDALFDDVVGLYTLDVGDHTDSASVMLKSGVIKPYFRCGQPPDHWNPPKSLAMDGI